jgi:hypothetical protein
MPAVQIEPSHSRKDRGPAVCQLPDQMPGIQDYQRHFERSRATRNSAGIIRGACVAIPAGWPYRIRRIVDAIRAIEDFRSRNHDEVAIVLAALIPSDRGFTQGYRSDLKCLSMDLLAPVVRGTGILPERVKEIILKLQADGIIEIEQKVQTLEGIKPFAQLYRWVRKGR